MFDKVDDFSFFAAIDMLIREEMKKFETNLLPVFQQATEDTGIPVHDVPFEGYYGETPELGEVLKYMRALQTNDSDVVTQSVEKLHSIYSNSVFGLGPAKYTAIIPENEVITLDTPGLEVEKAVLSPMWDTLGLAVGTVHYGQWGIQALMEWTEDQDLGLNNLVGLAILVDRQYKIKNGFYNPVATAMGAETTIGSRNSPMISLGGKEFPNVSEEVEEMGFKVINGYNDVFSSLPEGEGLAITTDSKKIYDKVMEIDYTGKVLGRCVKLGSIQDPLTQDINHYHWGINSSTFLAEESPEMKKEYPFALIVQDNWSDEIITSDALRKTIMSSYGDNIHKRTEARMTKLDKEK